MGSTDRILDAYTTTGLRVRQALEESMPAEDLSQLVLSWSILERKVADLGYRPLPLNLLRSPPGNAIAETYGTA